MKKIILTSIAAASLLFTYSCKTDFETDVKDIPVSRGNADFSKFVSVGNSLTSGYRDGTLYSDGQNESFPSMMAKQFALAGGGAFVQPMMPNNTGGFTNLPGFPGKYVLSVVNGALTPGPTAPAAALDIIGGTGKMFNNMGVPGAKSYHLLANGYGNPANLPLGLANPFFVRFATSGTTSVIADAVAQNPTFFSLWIGNNDVLGYATTGGDGTDPITPLATFTGAYDASVNALTANGAKGVVANIPNVTSLPFFTAVPYAPLSPSTFNSAAAGSASNQDQTIDALNTSLYGPLKQALTAFGAGDRIYQMISKTGASPLLIKDESLTNLSAQLTAALTPSLGAATAAAFGVIYGQARQTTSNDLVLLTTRAAIGSTVAGAPTTINKYGISYPLEDKHILRGKFGTQTASEVDDVLAATATFNGIIKSKADAKGLAFFDANLKMNELSAASGITFDGVKFTAKFVTGGTFSLDGVHLTGRGYAVIANEFLKAINSKYNSTLPLVNANSYSGVTFP